MERSNSAWLYRLLIRPLLFRLNPERAHHLTLRCLAQLGRSSPLQRGVARGYALDHPRLHVHVAGLQFSNPVGLAAGFDKDATAVAAFAALGFGFVEIGTVTPRPQRGNPLPRLFRLPADEAVINRLGFNSAGAPAVAARLRLAPRPIPVGVNVGKNAETPIERALEDYLTAIEHLYDLGDYLVVNVSSPNTPGVRHLQAYAQLSELLRAVRAHIQKLAQARRGSSRPLFVKIAPDLAAEELDGVVDAVQSCGVDGIIATNTTVQRAGLHTPTGEAGGLSGRPLRQRATEVIGYLYKQSRGRVPIIGVGGIFSAEEAYEKIRAGASLVQLYTGLIYRGPGLPYRINAGLLRLLDRDGFGRLSEAVGSAHS